MKYKTFHRFRALMLLVFLFSSAKAFSQDDFRRLRFGLKAAPDISWLNPDYRHWQRDGARLNFGYGLITEINFAKNYAFASGVEINGLSGRLTEKDSGIIIRETFRFQYLDIPLTVKMKTNEIGYYTYFGQFGLQPGFLLRAREDASATFFGATIPVENNSNINRKIIPVMLALVIGLGAEYSITDQFSVTAGLAFHKGMTDHFKDQSSFGSKIFYRATSNAVTLNLGVLF